jgi:glutamate dehydrogenase (NAD(P)+)
LKQGVTFFVALRALATQASTTPGQIAEPRFLEQVKMFFNRASSKTGVPQDYLDMIMACDTVVRFSIPIRRDNGTIQSITCYRAQLKHHHLPVKGGTRYATHIDI